MAISRARVTLFTTLTAATMAIAGIATFGVANAAPQDGETPSATEIPLAVEDFAYPGAAQIQQERQIVLKRGDGHITFVPCEGTTDIMVKSRTGVKKEYCFDVNAKQGHLTLELPDTFGIWTEAYPVTATLTANGKETVVHAAANDYQPMGETGNSGARSILLELRVG